MIKKFDNFTNNQIVDQVEEYPLIRHLTSYESAIHMLKSDIIMSRNVLSDTNFDINEVKGSDPKDKWWKERKELELEKFGPETSTEQLVPDVPQFKTTASPD